MNRFNFHHWGHWTRAHLLGSLDAVRSGPAARCVLFLLLALLVAGLLSVRTGWNHPADPPAAGINLLVDPSSTNLNVIPKEGPACATISARDAGITQAGEWAIEPIAPPARSSPVLEPAEDEPARLELGDSVPPIPAAEAPEEEEVTFAVRTIHQGDSPMLRDWKQFGFQTILATALASAPALAADAPPEPPLPPADLKKTPEPPSQAADLKKALDELNEKVKALQSEISNMKGENLNARLKLEADIDRLKKEVAQARAERPSQVTTRYPQVESATGRVRLVNTFFDPVTVVVNGETYYLAAGETRTTRPLPAGTFTYEVLGVQAQRSRSLASNETFTINVHP